MSLLISAEGLLKRRDVAASSLRPLAESLAIDLDPLLTSEPYFPEQKALLSREGGRCPHDGALLTFDPFRPHRHRCPICGTEYRGALHDRFWIYWYQLWLAERAVHAALLHRLGVGNRLDRVAAAILEGYVDRYATYPNVDNVLGPTRLFFSTYLESIWLLQISIAVDLLGDGPVADRVRDAIIAPSRAIIAEFDEGGSNRQVWNDAALLASALVLGDRAAAEQAVFGKSGIVQHLATGLLADGTWFEGENYHLFAHRGLWYGVTMAEEAGMSLPPSLVDRFQRGFATPFLSALPDCTLPSRRDSQYAISLRQWRIAEHVELGLARRADAALAGALERIYRQDIPRTRIGRWASSADAERNEPASSLTRADLSWRALLRALPELPPLEATPPRSTLLDHQGLAVFRRNSGRTYVALDYGHSGGGHGHPDRLNLLLADGATRWLDDYGTGSYVDPSLHWYRSTLAHNAPLAAGRSQPPRDGTLVAYDDRGAAGWISATAQLGEATRARRTIVVMDDYLVDRVVWTGVDPVSLDLPIHADLALPDEGARVPGVLVGGGGLEDGFDFAHETSCIRVPARDTVSGCAEQGSETLRLWARSDHDAEWWRATAPGPPGAAARAFRLVRMHAASAALTTVLAWSDDVADVELGDTIRVSMTDGSVHVHSPGEAAWRVELRCGTAHSSIDLGGVTPLPELQVAPAAPIAERGTLHLRHGEPVVVELAEAHFRRSEQSWSDASRPAATITFELHDGRLRIRVRVPHSDLTFVPADAVNRYDNEHPDVNGDGVQLYVETAAGRSAWMLIPELESSRVRTRVISGWTAPLGISASWHRDGDGYVLDAELGVVPSALDVVVNEMPRGRERRRGQLVLSGADGEFVYLRGDRHDPARLVTVLFDD